MHRSHVAIFISTLNSHETYFRAIIARLAVENKRYKVNSVNLSAYSHEMQTGYGTIVSKFIISNINERNYSQWIRMKKWVLWKEKKNFLLPIRIKLFMSHGKKSMKTSIHSTKTFPCMCISCKSEIKRNSHKVEETSIRQKISIFNGKKGNLLKYGARERSATLLERTIKIRNIRNELKFTNESKKKTEK